MIAFEYSHRRNIRARHNMQQEKMRHDILHQKRGTINRFTVGFAFLGEAFHFPNRHCSWCNICHSTLWHSANRWLYTISTFEMKTKKQTFKEWDNSPVCNSLQTLIVGAHPIELLGYKSLLLRGWNLLSERLKQVPTKVWWNFAGICQAEELCKEKKKKTKMHSFDLTEIYSL